MSLRAIGHVLPRLSVVEWLWAKRTIAHTSNFLRAVIVILAI